MAKYREKKEKTQEQKQSGSCSCGGWQRSRWWFTQTILRIIVYICCKGQVSQRPLLQQLLNLQGYKVELNTASSKCRCTLLNQRERGELVEIALEFTVGLWAQTASGSDLKKKAEYCVTLSTALWKKHQEPYCVSAVNTSPWVLNYNNSLWLLWTQSGLSVWIGRTCRTAIIKLYTASR